MQWIMLVLIQIYWKRPNRFKTACCHFKESCSQYVYRITQQEGFIAGLKAFRERFKQCRSGYAIIEIDAIEFIVFQDKTIIQRTETKI